MQRVHFIAIGGSVMHQLAIALHLKGYHVTGSDDEIFEPALTHLATHHILPTQFGWFPDKIDEHVDAVILGMHAKADNPEIQKAKQLGIPIYSFPEYIYEQSKNKLRIIVGGSHGKTSTTAMILHVLKHVNEKFDYLVGAKLAGFNQSVQITDAPVIVCEGDEYPASTIEPRPKFHFLKPHVAILTGIAWDHINVFPTYENYLLQFKLFIEKIESAGVLIYNSEDSELVKLVNENKRTDITYLPYAVPKHVIHNGKTSLIFDNQQFPIGVFGQHNLMNIEAARLALQQLKIDASQTYKALEHFSGAAKRLEKIAEANSCIAFRDFAHAPSKLKATLEAVKNQFSTHHIVAIFELHTYSSLNEKFLHQYANSMDKADIAFVYFSEHALQLKGLPPLQKQAIQQGFNSQAIQVFSQPQALKNELESLKYEKAVYIFMSSGNYDGIDIPTFAQTLITKTKHEP